MAPDQRGEDGPIRVDGERQSRTLSGVDRDVEVASERASVEIELADGADEVTVTVGGDRNSVLAYGRNAACALVVEGERNSLTVAEAVECSVEDRGVANSIERRDLGIEGGTDLVRQSREEAHADLGWFGYDLVSYQSQADEREFCHNCGRETDAIVHRHEERTLALFGLTFSVGETAVSDECEHCTLHVSDSEVSLTEAERREIFG